MKRLAALLTLGACGVLSAAAVWMGALNQDEGWYLYAANLVSAGQLPYRDFAFTQGPMMPIVYSAFCGVWRTFGLLGARVFTLLVGLAGIAFACALAYRLSPQPRRRTSALVVALLLGCNLYHLYFLAIPKTYALAALFVAMGAYLLTAARTSRLCVVCEVLGGVSLALAAGTRISLGAILPVVGVTLLVARQWRTLFAFCLGAFAALALVYGPFLLSDAARAGLIAAQKYHAARGGFDLTWLVGSFSRLIRWYLPVFIVLGLGSFRHARLLLAAFLAVFVVQMAAPFPYEDYQVPIMGLLAVFAAVNFAPVERGKGVLLVFGLAFATSFGSPLLEKWSTNGQDRFWSIKKKSSELAQLREMARIIRAEDPDGKDLLTQDLYLAIETGRTVPKVLEMGPFAVLTDAQWRALLDSAPCRLAALSGYSFAVNPPVCDERPFEQQMDYWRIVRKHYDLVLKEDHFGQNATTLLLLKRK